MAGVNRNYKKAGLPPGSLIYTGQKREKPADISVIEYSAETYKEVLTDWEQHLDTPHENTVRWVNIDGYQESELIEKVGNRYGLHPLVMEDILNTSQRPKLEDYGDYLYIVCKMIYYLPQSTEPVFEQESIVLGKDFILTFGEAKGDVFEPVRERLRNGAGRLRKHGADFLAYSLLDSIVDGYFVVLEKLGEEIEELDDSIVERPGRESLMSIRTYKKELLYMYKAIWPLREVFGVMERGETHLVGKATKYFIRDAYDHTIQCMDTTETYRDILSGMMDIYLSSISNRMNEVMKVLTIISTLFIPLTFIAGVYGMNFQFMPELGWKWGYFGVLGLMLAVAGLMMVYFKRKKWF